MKPSQPLSRYRWAVASRAFAAGLGGYALSAAFTAALALALLPMLPRVDAVMLATLLSWLVYACAIGWAFYARNAWRAWVGLLLPALAFLGVFLLAR